MGTRNERARLRKVTSHLEKALDELHRAGGELYPVNLKAFRTRMEAAIRLVSGIHIDALRGHFPPLQQLAPEDDEAENGRDDDA